MARTPTTITRNGKLYTWQPHDYAAEAEYVGKTPEQYAADQGFDLSDTGPGSGRGEYVEATYAHPGGLNPWKAIGMLAGAGTPAGAVGFTSFMHPDQEWLKYAAAGAGIAQGFGAFNGLTHAASAAPGGAGAATSGAGTLPPVGASLPTISGSTAVTLPGMASGGGGGGMAGGFLGGLLNFGKKAITGGDGFDVGDAIDIAGRVAGKWGDRRDADRESQAGYNLDYDRNAMLRGQLANAQVELDLKQREYADKARQQALADQVRAALLQGLNATTIDVPAGRHVADVGGGFTDYDKLHAAGATLGANAADRLAHPATLPGLPELPELSDVPEPGALDTALDWLNLGGGAVANIRQLSGGGTPNAPKPLPFVSASPSAIASSLGARSGAQAGSLPWIPSQTPWDTALGGLSLTGGARRTSPWAGLTLRPTGGTQPNLFRL